MGALFVRDVTEAEVLQTIKDKSWKNIMGEDEYDSNDDKDTIGPKDIERTFPHTELTPVVCQTISKCFSSIIKAHALVKEAYEDTSILVHVLLKRVMALFMEAMAMGQLFCRTLEHTVCYKRLKLIEESTKK